RAGSARCPAGDAGAVEGHRPPDRRRPLVGGPVPSVREPKAGGCLCRSSADAMAEWLDRSRAGCVQGGQPTAEDNDGRAGLAMAAERHMAILKEERQHFWVSYPVLTLRNARPIAGERPDLSPVAGRLLPE